jgi:hypothetical protein
MQVVRCEGGERHHRERRHQFAGRDPGLDYRMRTGWSDAIGAHRLAEMLDETFPQILDVGVQDRGQLLAHRGGNDGLTGARKHRQSLRNDRAVAGHVVAVKDHLADADSNSQQQMLVRWHTKIAAVGTVLDCEGGGNRSQHVVELEQRAVAEILDQPPAADRQHMALDMLYQIQPARNRPFLIPFGEAGRLGDIDDHHHPRCPAECVRWRSRLGSVSGFAHGRAETHHSVSSWVAWNDGGAPRGTGRNRDRWKAYDLRV